MACKYRESNKCGALRRLVPFVQFKKFFSRFLNYTNATKSRNAPQIFLFKILQS